MRFLPALGIAAVLLSPIYSPVERMSEEIRYSVVSKNPDGRKVGKILRYLQRVPEPMRAKLNGFGGEFVIFDRVSSLEGLGRSELILLSIAGAGYANKKAYVAENSETCGSSNGMTVPELHEAGHMVDEAYGFPSQNSRFRTLKPAALMGSYDHWAESYGRFYCDDNSNMELKEEFPDVHAYFFKFDAMNGNASVRVSR